jgi:uracil-DNA glycosylase
MSGSKFAILQEEMRSCCRCVEKGFPITPGAIFSGPAAARVMVVGQAPGVKEQGSGRPFSGPAGKRLFQWLAQAGWKEDKFRATQYITAITKCYPGKPQTTTRRPSHGDRVPSAAERNLCAPFLEGELEIVQPELILPIGRVAIHRFLGKGKLAELIGKVFERDGWLVLPLPHPSGANVWLNRPENKRLIDGAVGHLKQLKQRMRL